ncbi:DUF3954 domain-containing protein [Chengkuizengella sp. SCS-71B]|uniref:DUF3954 domain-containing protein n=1 Tax=Chengkuizengella sp. SCS-71B TaxID=3115290 RepID=UPI0039B74669
MNDKEPKINIIETESNQSQVYISKGGELTEVKPPKTGYREQIITWQAGKVKLVKTTNIEKI